MLARFVARTVQRFCESADLEPATHHTPRVKGVEDPAARAALAQVLVAGARRAWDDLSRIHGALRFDHDHYLKLWQLGRPRLHAEYVLFDEAQDANPVILDVVGAQQHAQRVLVGDSAQGDLWVARGDRRSGHLPGRASADPVAELPVRARDRRGSQQVAACAELSDADYRA